MELIGEQMAMEKAGLYLSPSHLLLTQTITSTCPPWVATTLLVS
jgi:hypothetical protein